MTARVSTQAIPSHRTRTAAAEVPYGPVLRSGVHRSVPPSDLMTATPSRNVPGFDIPDASLSEPDARARPAVGRHDNRRPGACVGSALQHDAATRDDESARTPRRSRCCRDRSGSRCEPARRNTGIGRAGRSARAWPARPLSQALWTAPGQDRHKEPAKPPAKAHAPGARGSDANQNTRAFGSRPLAAGSRTETPGYLGSPISAEVTLTPAHKHPHAFCRLAAADSPSWGSNRGWEGAASSRRLRTRQGNSRSLSPDLRGF